MNSAARHQPDAWRLVVPIDHDPAELAWFDGLRAGDYPFVDRWHGQTWLEEQLARHPDLVRYATQNKLLEYVRQYKLETESLIDGAATLLERHQALGQLADQVNPYWRPSVGRLPDGTLYSTVQPKRRDAANEAPISFTVSIEVPTTPEHDELREALRTGFELGVGATVPGEFVTEFTATGPPGLGLPSGERPDLLRFVAVPDADPGDLPTQTLAAYEPGAAVPLAALVFHPSDRTIGSAGARLTAYDSARTVKLVTDVRRDTVHLNLQAQHVRPIAPAALLPSLRLALAMHPPNRLVLTISKDADRYSEESAIHEPFLRDPPEDTVVQFIEDLAAIQDALHQAFPMPEKITGEYARNANRLRRLLAGERVPWRRGPLTVTLVPGRVEEFRAQFAAGPTGGLRISFDDVEFDFGEHTLHAGPVFLQGETSVDLDAIIVPEDGSSPTAEFEVLGDGWLYAERGVPDDGVSDAPEPARRRCRHVKAGVAIRPGIVHIAVGRG